MFQTYLKKQITQNGENQFLRLLNKYAPLKSKVIGGNNNSFVTNTLRKAIMRRSALKKKAKAIHN